MSYACIRFDRPAPHVVAITLDRPERLNALNGPLLDELADAVERVSADDEVRVFLLTGAARSDGRPCFSAGVDLRGFEEGKGVTEAQGFRLTNTIEALRKPSIAVIDGVCTTGAAELALACDFRLVGAAAEISDWHLKNLGTGLGAWGASTRWLRRVGATRAKEIILTGKVVGAEEAVRIGLATAAHATEQLFEAALAMAETIAGMDPAGVALTLSHLYAAEDQPRELALRHAQLAPRWQGVSVELRGKGERVLATREKSKASSRGARRAPNAED